MRRLTKCQSKPRFQQGWSQYDTNIQWVQSFPYVVIFLHVGCFFFFSCSAVTQKSSVYVTLVSRTNSVLHTYLMKNLMNGKQRLPDWMQRITSQWSRAPKTNTKSSPAIIFQRDKSDTNPAHRPTLSLLCSCLPYTLSPKPSVRTRPFVNRTGMGG